MRNLKLVLQREPAAVGTLTASIMPVLVVFGVLDIDDAGIAAVAMAVNAVVGFATRVLVAPTAGPSAAAPANEGRPVVA
jgi:hypothetical protein